MTGAMRLIALGISLLVWCYPHSSAMAVKGKEKQAKTESQRWPVAITLAPQLGLSDVDEVPIGGGLSLAVLTSPIERFSVGVAASWSRHGALDFLRAALLLQILIDDLAIHPFLQTGIGLQMKLLAGGISFSPDLHIGLGFDVPLQSWLTAGASFQVHFPIDPQAFPVTKTLHLRLSLLF